MSIESKIDTITNTTSSLVKDAENMHGNMSRPNWLCFTAESAGSTLRLNRNNTPPVIQLEYSTDGDTWSPYAWSGSDGYLVTLASIGDKVYFRGLNKEFSTGWSGGWYTFVMTGTIGASGNVMSLLDPTCRQNKVGDFCFMQLFVNCTSLTKAPELPATILGQQCYAAMFGGCTALKKAPTLPATVFPSQCYINMFQGCTSLEEAELPQEKSWDSFGNNCFVSMFYGCTSLKRLRVGFNTNYVFGFTSNWLYDAGAQDPVFGWRGGFFEVTSNLNTSSLTRGVDNIPTTWTIVRTDPTVPAGQSKCELYQFSDNTSLVLDPSTNIVSTYNLGNYNLTITPSVGNTVWSGLGGCICYKEIVVMMGGTGTLVAGTGLRIVDQPEAGYVNHCVIKWGAAGMGTGWVPYTASLYVIDKVEIPT